MSSPHKRESYFLLTFTRISTQIKKILLHRGICFFLSIQCSIQLLVYTRMDSWILVLYFGQHSRTTLFCCSHYFSFGHWRFLHLAPMPLCHISITVDIWKEMGNLLLYFLLQTHVEYLLSNARISHFSRQPWLLVYIYTSIHLFICNHLYQY